jgi:hypothetical protein
VATHRRALRARRRWVQSRRQVPDGQILGRLALSIETSQRSADQVPDWVNRAMSWYGNRVLRRNRRPALRRGGRDSRTGG